MKSTILSHRVGPRQPPTPSSSPLWSQNGVGGGIDGVNSLTNTVKVHSSLSMMRASWMKLLVLIMVMVVGIHRICSTYEGRREFVHAPIHTIARTCPEPSYTTIASKEGTSTISQSKQRRKICLTTLTDEQERGPLQKMLRWRNFDGLLELTWQNKLDYAKKYEYHLFDESDQLDRSRPPSWSKIKAVRRLLTEEGCNWVWWLDADTVIMNSEKRLESFLPSDDSPQDILLSQDNAGGYNAGGWLIRNSSYAVEFLDEWWNMESYVKPPGLAKSGDNDAFKAMLAVLPEFDQHVLVPPRCTFNSFAKFVPPSQFEKMKHKKVEEQEWYLDEAFYHKGDLLAHVAGYNNKEQPVQMLLDLAK